MQSSPSKAGDGSPCHVSLGVPEEALDASRRLRSVKSAPSAQRILKWEGILQSERPIIQALYVRSSGVRTRSDRKDGNRCCDPGRMGSDGAQSRKRRFKRIVNWCNRRER